MKTLGKLVTIILFATAGILSMAFAITVAWRWYMVPAFNLPAISLLTAIGMGAIATLLNPPPFNYAQNPEYSGKFIQQLGLYFGSRILGPFIVIGVLWICKTLLG